MGIPTQRANPTKAGGFFSLRTFTSPVTPFGKVTALPQTVKGTLSTWRWLQKRNFNFAFWDY
jgi:hypothetical protein